jgi:hypothetical protein
MNTDYESNRSVRYRALLLSAALVTVTAISTQMRADTGTCGGASVTLPFTDVMGNAFFCQIAEAYFSGLTNGTTATSYSPGNNVTRDQMAAFIARTQNSVLNRGSRRAALNQVWTTTPHYDITQGAGMLGTTTVDSAPVSVASDGADLWVANQNGS